MAQDMISLAAKELALNEVLHPHRFAMIKWGDSSDCVSRQRTESLKVNILLES